MKNRIFYDTEFLEDGNELYLISIGMVRESDKEKLYLANRDMPVRKIKKNKWLMENVVPGLPKGYGEMRIFMPNRWLFHYGDSRVQPYEKIARIVKEFIVSSGPVSLWAWYGAYDHVLLSQMMGGVSDQNPVMPMWTNDLRQEAERLGNPDLPIQENRIHHALEDAKHNMEMAFVLDKIREEQGKK